MTEVENDSNFKTNSNLPNQFRLNRELLPSIQNSYHQQQDEH